MDMETEYFHTLLMNPEVPVYVSIIQFQGEKFARGTHLRVYNKHQRVTEHIALSLDWNINPTFSDTNYDLWWGLDDA